MKLYRTLTAPVRFHAGQKLHLSSAQVALRAHNLQVGKSNARTGAIEVEVINPIEFKRGELIWLSEADLSRALEGMLEFVRNAKPSKSNQVAPGAGGAAAGVVVDDGAQGADDAGADAGPKTGEAK